MIFNCEFSAGFFLVQGKENRATPVGLASTLQDRRWVVCLFSVLSYTSPVVKRGGGSVRMLLQLSLSLMVWGELLFSNRWERESQRSIMTVEICNRSRPAYSDFSSNLNLLQYNQNMGFERDGGRQRTILINMVYHTWL